MALSVLLHELFEVTADAFPERVALLRGEMETTYVELERRANRLANYLRDQGVTRGSYVAFLLPRGTEAYVALLAILKSGAAYVPIDPDYPAERVAYIVSDCAAHVLLTNRALAGKIELQGTRIVTLDSQAEEIAAASERRLSRTETGLTETDLCYVIYTSGSTGKPKGVQVEHRNACHLVRAERQLFEVRPDDRVYQGFSLAFDASVEEVWLAFHSGAALVVGTAEMVKSGPELSGQLTWAGVTVFSTVPTLLSMLNEDIPTLRLLILGGEACPQELVARWCRPGLRMVNTYGPTEATVIATYADCDPAQPVTIGKAVPGYHIYLLDEQLSPVLAGSAGEICVGGPGVARGYLGRDDLTRDRFVSNPFAADGSSSRLYRTGDLGRLDARGNIEFLGRADGQVKLRGFRVELGEVEAALLACEGVRAAAATVREDIPGVRQLVGYIVTRPGASCDEQILRTQLRGHLPSYMVPAVIESLTELPTLPSGKVDRAALPAPASRENQRRTDFVGPRTDLERKLVAVWERSFAPARVSVRDDFFLDLGGHSLLAAGVVSELRKDASFANLSVRDVYDHPTAEALAEYLEKTPEPIVAPEPRTFRRASNLAFRLCGLGQLFGLYLVLAVYSFQWLAPYLTYTWLRADEYEVSESLIAAFASVLAIYPTILALSIVVKWLVIGRFKAGEYPLWGFYYFRWWLVRSLLSAIPTGYLAGTPLLNWYYRLLGAKIGKDVYLGSDEVFSFDLISVGDSSSIGTETTLLGYTVEDGWLKIGPVRVGSGCFVGNRCVLSRGVSMGAGSALEDLSMLPAGTHLPAGERWTGSPARAITGEGDAPSVEAVASFGRLRRVLTFLLYALGVQLIPVFMVAAILPGIMLMDQLDTMDEHYWYLLAAPFVGLSFVLLLTLEIAAVKWVLLGRVRPGTYPLHGWFYARKWFVDKLLELSLDVLGPLYATIYLAPWYRLLGAKIGRRAEVSTASFISPDLLEVGEEGFVADAVSLGAARVERGTVRVGRCRIGPRAFVGNSALMPPDSAIGESVLIGCLSTLPLDRPAATKTDSSWLGSPAFFLPQRQKSSTFGEEQTFNPTRRLWLLRGAIEFFRVTLPASCFIVLSSVLLSLVGQIRWYASERDLSDAVLLPFFPLLYLAAGLVAVLFAIAMKWLLVARYRPGEQPLWSDFVWRSELATSLRENLADLYLLDILRGTPFLAPFFRLLGTRIGRRVYMDTTDITEFDLVHIGDDVALNRFCTIQTHLFEDRVMKMSTIDIGDRCSVGAMSLVLYDTTMEEGSSLGNLSLLMKGEVLPAGTAWEGSPAGPMLASQGETEDAVQSVRQIAAVRQDAKTNLADAKP
jgi:non-ribosomal peptide synthetase-like protein